MNRFYQSIALLLILFSSCDIATITDAPLTNEETFNLLTILEKSVPVGFHPDLPNSKTYFQGSGVIGYSYHYFDSLGKELVKVGLGPERDTTGFSFFTYSEKGLLIEKKVNILRNQAFPWEVFQYHYNDSDQLKQITRNGNNFELYEYNELGQVVKVNLGGNLQLAEIYIFEYDSMGRVKRQLYKSQIEGDSPLRDWYYEYNSDGLLVSKSIPISDTQKEVMFEYRYDAQNRLVEETEYYPEYGFSLCLRSIIHYA
ncbi:RHS repeat domain-containing protein [Aquiflexum sp.]|uniref:RHS repeat domain-containing protein n=1 Tax=Aquiflexum sp. TaxID=1872584 RepID=UPI003593DEF9